MKRKIFKGTTTYNAVEKTLLLPYFEERARMKKINPTDFQILVMLSQIDKEKRTARYIAGKLGKEYQYVRQRINVLQINNYISKVKEKNKSFLFLTQEGMGYKDKCIKDLFGRSSSNDETGTNKIP